VCVQELAAAPAAWHMAQEVDHPEWGGGRFEPELHRRHDREGGHAW
jgi:hypothetical protein